MSIIIDATTDGRVVTIRATWHPVGQRSWTGRILLHKGTFVLPPCKLTRSQSLALIGEYLARYGVQESHLTALGLPSTSLQPMLPGMQ